MPSLSNLVQELDARLTGKDAATVAQTARNQSRLLSNEAAFLMMDDAYYLSDGGYSRVRVNEETGRLSLMSQSRDVVKARWREATNEIAAIETVLREFLNSHGLLDGDA